MVVYEDVPVRLRKFHQDWTAIRSPWLRRALLAEEYYLNDVEGTGTTFTRKQDKTVKDVLNMNASLNFIYPLVDQKHAVLVRSKPSHRIIPIGKSSKDMAYVLDKAKHAILHNSQANSEAREVVRDMLISGMGIHGVFDEDFYTEGEFGIAYSYLHYSEVILDARSRRRSGQDSRGVWTEKEIPLDMAETLYNDLLAEMNAYYGTEYTMENFSGTLFSSPKNRAIDQTGEANKIIELRNFYETVYSTVYLREIEKDGDVEWVFEENFFPEEWDAIYNVENNGFIDSRKGKFVKRYLFLGDKLVLKEMKAFDKIPIRADYYQWGGQPYKSYGMIHYEQPKQDALDKSVHVMILNGMLSNNAGWSAPKGSIHENDKTKWENVGAKPGVVREFTPVVLHGKLFVPERDVPPQLSSFFPMLIQMLKSGMEFSTNIGPEITGNSQESKIDVFSVLQQYQNSAMQRIIRDIEYINEGQAYIGDIIVQAVISTLRPDQTYSFLDTKGKLNEINVAKEAIRDLRLGRYKVLAIAAEAMPTQRMNMAIEMMKIAQSSQDPNKRDYYVQTAFSLSDFRAFDEIAEDIDKINELTGELKQMSDKLDRSTELMKQHENARINSEVKAKIAAKYIQILEKLTRAAVTKEDELLIDSLKKQLKVKEKENGSA